MILILNINLRIFFYSKLGHKIKKCALDFKLHFKNKFDLKTKAQKEEKILIIRISMIVT